MSGQASYAYDASAHAAAQAAAQAAGTSTAADPYAAFYYWDPAQNNYAFDYDSYYTTYGYPDQAAYGAAGPSTSGTSYDPNFAADANAQASAYMPTPEGAAAANGTAANAEKKKGRLQKGETRQTVLRKAAGILWEDETLLEWDPSMLPSKLAHKRLFVGDLGNDVSDEVLTKAFSKYASFSKARVVRNKFDMKSKGYGFVAFSDPEDFLKAWKEMNGKYVGSRPVRLKKANDNVAPVTIGARKDRLLAANQAYEEHLLKSKMGGPIGKDLRRNGGVGKPYAKR